MGQIRGERRSLRLRSDYDRAGETTWGQVLKSSIKFGKVLSRGHWNFELQNTVLESSIIITNYSIIIIIIIIIKGYYS
jgi:hypothetical protein